jgi:hypothetical protein
MLGTLLFVLDKYGLQVVNLILLGLVSWKLFTNHLKHILISINENKNELEHINKNVIDLKERVSKLEGKLD